jgi:hypothetical protein
MQVGQEIPRLLCLRVEKGETGILMEKISI